MKKLFTILAACLCVSSMWGDRTFKLVTDVNDVVADANYLVVSSYEGTNYVMGGQNTTNNRKGVVVTITNNTITSNDLATSSADTEKPHVIQLKAGSTSGTWNLYDVAESKYLNGGFGKSGGAKSNSNHLKVADAVATSSDHKTVDGNFSLSFDAETSEATLTNGNGWKVMMNQNVQSGVVTPIFATYESGSYQPIHLYREIVAEVTVTTAQYATYYNASSAYVMPENLEGITVEGVINNTLTLETRYAAGSVVPVGEALVLHGAAGPYTLYAGTTTNSKIAANMLKGTSTADEMTTGNAGDVFYRLSQHDSKVGFYYGAEGGAEFKPGANKAYLALNGASAPARFIFGQQDVPTELQNVSAEAVSRKVMIDGRLYILRDGNLFDLNGRLVK